MTFRSFLFSIGLVPLVVAACGPQGQGPRGLSHQDRAALQAIAGRDTRFGSSWSRHLRLRRFEFHLVDLDGDGELAFMRSNVSMTFTLPGAAKPISVSGKILVVLRKQPDGSWLRVADAWNSSLSPSK